MAPSPSAPLLFLTPDQGGATHSTTLFARPVAKRIFLTPHDRPLLLNHSEQGLAQIAAFGDLSFQHKQASHTRTRNTSINMSFDWDHQFCLGCDKQTEGSAYCSESCRLADYEKTSPSSPSSGASSPAFNQQKFYLSPAYEFSPFSSAASTRSLSPSSSHASLSSLRSNSSSASTSTTTSAQQQQLAEKSAQELRAYARSFESVRMQRRRSY
ncbi:hypothetical protein QBC43DRAFT_215752 [Cladorrhinum sp. PSN259]|nr:hypothetical protein QBC43DRAFT_215752 [Cladorrhinum sp. PSN259]